MVGGGVVGEWVIWLVNNRYMVVHGLIDKWLVCGKLINGWLIGEDLIDGWWAGVDDIRVGGRVEVATIIPKLAHS